MTAELGGVPRENDRLPGQEVAIPSVGTDIPPRIDRGMLPSIMTSLAATHDRPVVSSPLVELDRQQPPGSTLEKKLAPVKVVDVVGGSPQDQAAVVTARILPLLRRNPDATVITLTLDGRVSDGLVAAAQKERDAEGNSAIQVARWEGSASDLLSSGNYDPKRFGRVVAGSIPDSKKDEKDEHTVEADILTRVYHSMSVPDPEQPGKRIGPTLAGVHYGLEIVNKLDVGASLPKDLRNALLSMRNAYPEEKIVSARTYVASLLPADREEGTQAVPDASTQADQPATSGTGRTIEQHAPQSQRAGLVDVSIPGARVDEANVAVAHMLDRIAHDTPLGVPNVLVINGALNDSLRADAIRICGENGVSLMIVDPRNPTAESVAQLGANGHGYVILHIGNETAAQHVSSAIGKTRLWEASSHAVNTGGNDGWNKGTGTNEGWSVNYQSREGVLGGILDLLSRKKTEGKSGGKSTSEGTSGGNSWGETTTRTLSEVPEYRAEEIRKLTSGEYIVGIAGSAGIADLKHELTSGSTLPLTWQLRELMGQEQLKQLHERTLDPQAPARPDTKKLSRKEAAAQVSHAVNQQLAANRERADRLGGILPPIQEWVSGVDLTMPPTQITASHLVALNEIAAIPDTRDQRYAFDQLARDSGLTPQVLEHEVTRYAAIAEFANLGSGDQSTLLSTLAARQGVDPEYMKALIEREGAKAAVYREHLREQAAQAPQGTVVYAADQQSSPEANTI